MIRRLFLTLVFVTLAALAHADGPMIPRSAFEQLDLFQKNHALLEALVENGVRLTHEDDPLARANASTEVARRFANELQAAARQHDAARTAELGRHLQHVLERGVADNLQAARRMIPVGSTEERKLTEAIQQARTLLQPFRASLQEAAAGEEQGEVRALLEDLARRQTELEKKLDKSSPTQQLD